MPRSHRAAVAAALATALLAPLPTRAQERYGINWAMVEWDTNTPATPPILPRGCTCLATGESDDKCDIFNCLCTCDLTPGKCDPNCCCDPDCTTAQVDGFKGINAFKEKADTCRSDGSSDASTQLCQPRAEWNKEVRKINNKFKMEVQDPLDLMDPLLCVVADNSESEGTFYGDIGVVSSSIFSSSVAQRVYTYRPDGSVLPIQPNWDGFPAGAQIPAAMQEGPTVLRSIYGGFLSLPSAGYAGTCNDFNTAKFMRNEQSECLRVFTSLKDECSRSLNVAKLTTALRVGKTAKSIAAITKGNSVPVSVDVTQVVTRQLAVQTDGSVTFDPANDGVLPGDVNSTIETAYREDVESKVASINEVQLISSNASVYPRPRQVLVLKSAKEAKTIVQLVLRATVNGTSASGARKIFRERSAITSLQFTFAGVAGGAAATGAVDGNVSAAALKAFLVQNNVSSSEHIAVSKLGPSVLLVSTVNASSATTTTNGTGFACNNDGIANNGETDVDCGNTIRSGCGPCKEIAKSCQVDSDCGITAAGQDLKCNTFTSSTVRICLPDSSAGAGTDLSHVCPSGAEYCTYEVTATWTVQSRYDSRGYSVAWIEFPNAGATAAIGGGNGTSGVGANATANSTANATGNSTNVTAAAAAAAYDHTLSWTPMPFTSTLVQAGVQGPSGVFYLSQGGAVSDPISVNASETSMQLAIAKLIGTNVTVRRSVVRSPEYSIKPGNAVTTGTCGCENLTRTYCRDPSSAPAGSASPASAFTASSLALCAPCPTGVNASASSCATVTPSLSASGVASCQAWCFGSSAAAAPNATNVTLTTAVPSGGHVGWQWDISFDSSVPPVKPLGLNATGLRGANTTLAFNATKHNDGNELGGTWQLFYKATSKELPWNATEFEVAAAVRSISQGVGVSAVTRTRSNFTGAYNWRVEFVEKAPDVLVALTGKLSGSWGAQKMKVTQVRAGQRGETGTQTKAMCVNAVVGVEYDVRYSATTFEISSVSARLVVGNISANISSSASTSSSSTSLSSASSASSSSAASSALTVPLSLRQSYAVKFDDGSASSSAAAQQVRFSGNPGYQQGKPLRAGVVVTQGGSGSGSGGAQMKTAISERVGGFALRGRGANGICNGTATEAGGRFYPLGVGFGEDVRVGCTMRMSAATLRDYCLGQAARHAAGAGSGLGLIPPALAFGDTHVAAFGNSLASEPSKWVQITSAAADARAAVAPRWDQRTRTCSHAVSGVHLKVLYAPVGAIGNPQYKVVGAHVELVRDTLRFGLRDEGAEQGYALSTTVSFVRYNEDAARDRVPTKVPFNFDYPNVFRPFHSNAAASAGGGGPSVWVVALLSAAVAAMAVGAGGAETR